MLSFFFWSQDVNIHIKLGAIKRNTLACYQLRHAFIFCVCINVAVVATLIFIKQVYFGG